MNAPAPDLLEDINNAVIDLQNSDYQTYQRPIKVLGRLLNHPDLSEINAKLKEGVDLKQFLSNAEESGGSFVGSNVLDWPEDPKNCLGISLILVESFAENPQTLLSFGRKFYYSGGKYNNMLNSVTGKLVIPFARDYRRYIQSQGAVTPKLRTVVSKKIFIVHGHDGEAREATARFLSHIGFEPIILHEQANKGRTVIEKVEANADVGFAVVLLTPDDEGRAKKDLGGFSDRAR
ncbi:MAG: hypothetical protein EOP04_32625, partial [Proteobacteria bacterium]